MDALSIIALSKMAVIVIGIFMVPIITRKLVVSLSLPVGQMAMDRGALAAGGLGFAALRLMSGASQSLTSHTAAQISPPMAQRLTHLGASLKNRASVKSENSEGDRGFANDFSPLATLPLASMAGSTLERLGSLLENTGLRHKAAIAGNPPPTLRERLMKAVSMDPDVLRPIQDKENRYRDFVQSQKSGMQAHSFRSPSNGGSFGTENSKASSISSESHTANHWFSATPPRTNNVSQNSGFRQHSIHNSIQNRGIEGGSAQTSIQQNQNRNAAPRYPKISHRWLNSSSAKRLFDDTERKNT